MAFLIGTAFVDRSPTCVGCDLYELLCLSEVGDQTCLKPRVTLLLSSFWDGVSEVLLMFLRSESMCALFWSCRVFK
jgi:hypothetical protein